MHSKLFHGTWVTFFVCLLVGFLLATILFWIPMAALYSVNSLSVTNINSIADTFALACTTLLSIPSVYVPTTATAVIVISIETGVGRLILAGVTAVLVVKASKVQNEIVISEKLLCHKFHGSWYLSLRVGVMYGQRIYGSQFRMATVGNIPGQAGDVNMVNLKLHDIANTGGIEMGGVPRNIRHRIDETSPLFHLVDFLENSKDFSGYLQSIYFFLNGVDELSGRGVGKSRCYQLSSGDIVVNKHARLHDVVIPRRNLPDAIRNGSLFHRRRKVSRNQIAAELTDYLDENRHVKVGIYWPNFHLYETSSHEEKEETIVIQGEQDRATPTVAIE